MLQVQKIRENKEEMINLLMKRGIDAEPIFNKLIELDQKRKDTQSLLDEQLAQSNAFAKEIGGLFKSGKTAEANEKKAATAELKQHAKKLSIEQEDIRFKLHELLTQIPNIPHHSVPEGKTEDDNEFVRNGGRMPELAEDAKPHWELASDHNLIDFELGVKVTGAGFPFYMGQGARLQRALINMFLDKNAEAGYKEVLPPLVVNKESGFGTGQLPDKERQMYHVTGDDLYLIPTAEVPVTNIFRDEILDQSEFPVKCTAYTPCFRREAGSYGKDVRGLNRLHQFDKVEIVQIQDPAKSYETLEEMVTHVEGILNDLELPYRIVRLCGGDLGFTSALTYDFEVWSAAQERWLEVSSVSNFESFQANRLKLRYRSGEKKPQLCHTLNGSALALPRILAALLENNQTPDGITIPKALQSYTGFSMITN